MPLYSYHCPAGHATERLNPRSVEIISCPCGLAASRLAVYPIGVTGFTPTPRDEKSYRQSFGEYREASQEVDYAYSKREADGDPVSTPNYAAIGIARARERS